MESPEKDVNRSPLIKPEPEDTQARGIFSPEHPGETAVTRPMSVSPDQQAQGPENPSGISGDRSTPDRHPIEETQISQSSGDGINLPPEIPSDQPENSPTGKRRWILWSVFGVILLALIAAGSVYAGYSSAINERTRNESTLVAAEASNQYILAQQDIALGKYDLARQRLEYIIQIDPNYPGASEQLALVLTQQRITASPTLAPTPTLTPTPDYRTRDELYANAQNLLLGRDWTGAIDTLLLLRKNYPDYMAVKVDGMLFVALRNRGIDKIAQQHDLEGGNYDLTLAERFGPLDAEAINWREWAELYIRGASFWAVDWAQSLYYFSQLASAAPNLSDISGWTATNRYLDALLGYGNWLAAKGEWCDAQTQFDTYMTLLASPQVEPTAVYIAEQCSSGAGPEETPTGDLTTTPGTPESTPSP